MSADSPEPSPLLPADLPASSPSVGASPVEPDSATVQVDPSLVGHLASLFEHAPGFAAILSGPEHVFAFANAPYLRLVGHRDLSGRTVAEALPETVEQGFVGLLDGVFQSGEPFIGRGMVARLQHERGGPTEEAIVDFVYQPIRDSDGRITGIFVQGSDVTRAAELVSNARAAEAATEEAYAELESLYRASPVALTALRRGPDGKYRYVRSNEAHGRMHGLPPDALRGRTLDEVVPALAPHLTAVFDQVVETGESLTNVTVEGELGNGEHHLWSANYYPIPTGASGEPAVGVSSLDITEQRRTDAALRAAADRATFLTALGDALRPLADADAIQATAARMLGAHLGATRAFYAEADADGEHVVVAGGPDGLASPLAGRHRLADFGASVADALQRGVAVVDGDTAANAALSGADQAAYAALGVGAHIAAPLVREARLAGLVGVHSASPRPWTDNEVALVEETAVRTWSASRQARAEAALREREARYHALFTSIDEGFALCEIVTDDSGAAIDYRFLDVNPLFETMTGLVGAVGRTAHELVPNLEQVWVDTYARVAFGGEPLRFEQGSAAMGRVFNVFATPVEPRGRFAVVFTDVTARRRAEAAFQESEENLRLALEGGEMGVWSWDLASGVVTADARLRAIWGLDPTDDLVFTDFFARIHPGDIPRLQAEIREARASLGTYTTEFRILLPEALGGGVRWLAGPGRALMAPGSEAATRLVGVNFDITERREAEDALREGEARFRNMADHSPAMVWVTDPDGACTYLNARWYAFTGQTPEQALGMGWLDAVHPDDAEAAGRVFLDANARQTPFSLEYRLRRYDGVYRWAIDAAAPRFGAPDGEASGADAAGRGGAAQFLGYIGSVVDIDDQKAAERQLREANERLEARVIARTADLEGANAQLELRNRELQDFAYVASHDLQEPLRKIQSFAGLIAAEYGETLGDEGSHYLQRTQDAAARMSGLIRDLLAFSRIATSQNPVEPVDLDAILAAVLGDLEVRIAQSGGRVEAGTLGTVSADPLQMRQLFQNLVGNALKFHHAGQAPVVRVRAERSADAVTLHVEDDGVGFDGRHVERIFAPFQRLHAKSAYEGTGMGLAIVRRIAERHRGTVTATSTPGEGAHFTVTLPQG